VKYELHEQKFPLISVVILNWNAGRYLEGCLRSVLNANYPNLEIILVDNASTDGSIEQVRDLVVSNAERVKLIQNESNCGPARALNVGVRIACGEYITILGSDTEVDSLCFMEIAKVMVADSTIGACGSKLLYMNDRGRLDHAGEYLSQCGLLIQRIAGREMDEGQFDSVDEIFGVKGTALTVRREVLEKVGLFDEDFFIFLEETDLCWRIWLNGHRIVFAPDSRIYHASAISIESSPQRNYLVKYYGTRNYIIMLLKNLETMNLLKILPIHVSLWFGLSVLLCLKGRFLESWYVASGVGANIIRFKDIMEKRKGVNRIRVVSDEVLLPKIMRKISWGYLVNRALWW